MKAEDNCGFTLEERVTYMIRSLGIPPDILGYYYIRSAIEMIYEDISLLGRLTSEVYPTVAIRYNTTPSRVERAIRYLIGIVQSTSVGEDKFKQLFKYSPKECTNKEFIALIVDEIKLADRKIGCEKKF